MKQLLAVIVLIFGLMVDRTAQADSLNGSFSVAANVQQACSIVSATLDFGSYSSGQTGDLDFDGTFRYSGCNSSTLTVELDPGLLGDDVSRQMENAQGDKLRYNIHRTAQRNNIWGRFSNAVSVTSDESGAGSVPLYGRITGAQTVAAGDYTDTVGIALTF